MVDDDDVTFHRPASHFGNEAALPLWTFLSGATLGAGIQLGPELAVFRQSTQFGAISAFRDLLPFGNLAIVLDLFQPAEDRLIGQVVEFLPAEIVIAALHVTDAQLSQVLLQEWNVLEEELLLKCLGSSGNNYAFAAAYDRQQISQCLACAGAGFHNQVSAFIEGALNRLRHL